MKLKTAMLSSLILFSVGCASTQPPAGSVLDALPLVAFGDQVPADGNYILHFPVGVAIDTPVTFSGNLFQSDDTEILSVVPKQDIYVYKQWVSYDRKNWRHGEGAMRLDVQLKLPGYDHPKTGYVRLKLDKLEE